MSALTQLKGGFNRLDDVRKMSWFKTCSGGNREITDETRGLFNLCIPTCIVPLKDGVATLVRNPQ